MTILRRPLAGAAICAACALATPTLAEVPYDGWRGQRAGADYAGAPVSRRPLDNSPRYGEPYAAARESWSDRPSPASRPPMWHGFYAGGHISGAWGSATPQGLSADAVALDGFTGGGHLGYNLQYGTIVIGVEADGSWSGVDGMRLYGSTTSAAGVNLDWMATLRARAGITFDNFFFYGTAGIAFSGIDLDVTTAAGQSSTRDKLTGLVYGGGVEMKITPQLSARFEALRTNFGDEVLGSAAGPISIGADVTMIRAGLSWHFN
jgi:outer membrane immunogenic protein